MRDISEILPKRSAPVEMPKHTPRKQPKGRCPICRGTKEMMGNPSGIVGAQEPVPCTCTYQTEDEE